MYKKLGKNGELKVKKCYWNEMWLVNVVLHAFEHFAKQFKYCGYMTCVLIFHRRGVPIFHILPHCRHTRPPRLWHIHNRTCFFQLTQQYRNIPVACKGASTLPTTCRSTCQSTLSLHKCRSSDGIYI